MRSMIVAACVLCVVLGLCLSLRAETETITPTEIEIVISPNTLVMDSQGVWVTVHADIPLKSVAGFTVTLNGIPVEVVKADNHGDLVAKFELDAVKNIIDPPSATLTLAGELSDGGAFEGTDTIRVK